MAMTKCRECGKDVSTEANVCPHCGVENPSFTFAIPAPEKKKDQGLGIVGGLFVLLGTFFIVFSLLKCTSSDETESRVKIAAECRQSLQCWGDKNSLAASMKCDQEIERLAKNSFKWTDKTLESKFSHHRWLDKDAGTLTYIGDKIQYQNGFGAWVNHIYECDFDPATKTVLGVRAEQGRL